MPIIWSLMPATESDALLVVDMQNSSLKSVNLSSGTVKVLYRSSDTYFRGAAFVANAQNRMHSLLLVEMHSDAVAQTKAYSLVVAELRGTTWTSLQRFALESAPTGLEDSSFASICTVYTSKVLIGLCGSASLHVLSVTTAREAHKDAPFRLGCTQYCFTYGVCDCSTLLFGGDWDTAKMHIQEVRDGEPLALQLLRCSDVLYLEGNSSGWTMASYSAPPNTASSSKPMKCGSGGFRTVVVALNPWREVPSLTLTTCESLARVRSARRLQYATGRLKTWLSTRVISTNTRTFKSV